MFNCKKSDLCNKTDFIMKKSYLLILFLIIACSRQNETVIPGDNENNIPSETPNGSGEDNTPDDGTDDENAEYKDVLSLLNLEYPGLGNVKAAFEQGDYQTAAENLLSYYRNRTGIKQPELDLENMKVTAGDRKKADDALGHIFQAHDGYPPYFYGDDIDWTYWPVKDNELRYQLHRHYWFVPMGKVYYQTKDETYAREWIFQYLDWIKKNPMSQKNGTAAERENYRFAWRQLKKTALFKPQTQTYGILR